MYTVTQQYIPVLQVRTQYVHTPGEPVTQSPWTLGLSFLSVSFISLLCGSLRLHLFPSSLYYSPPLVIVYKLTITAIIRSFTSCDGTSNLSSYTIDINNINSNELANQSKGASITLHAPVQTKRTNRMAQENHQMSTFEPTFKTESYQLFCRVPGL
jgi:hypothetical protein